MTNKIDTALANSTGQDFSESAHLDRHFVACQPEYEAMLKSVGLKAGWRVLDAGCGSGAFLPLMSQLLGSSGQIEAIDLASENVALVETQQTQNKFACPVTVQVGTVVKLPYEDDTFDVVWCANTTQYLNDNELNSMLYEFQRVLKPGGVMALKDFSLMCWQWQPLDPLLLPRAIQAEIDAGNKYAIQALRDAALPTWVKRAGFKIVHANTIMSERWQPLRDIEKALIAGSVSYMAANAKANEHLSDADHIVWDQLADLNSPDHILNHPDFYYGEGHIMIVAKNP